MKLSIICFVCSYIVLQITDSFVVVLRNRSATQLLDFPALHSSCQGSVFLQFFLNRVSCCWRLHNIQDLLASIGIKRTLFYRSLTHFLLFCEAGPPRQLLYSPALIILAKVGALQLLKVLQHTWTNEKNLSFNESKDDTISRSSPRKRH